MQQNTFRLHQQAVQHLADEYGTPLLVLSLSQVRDNYRYITQYLPGVQVYYAMKANPDERLIQTLAQLGSCFDVASDGEMLALSAMGISGDRMIYANPVKTSGGLAAARQTGVGTFTYDSESEIRKLAQAAPGSRVLLRIRVDNPQAHVDLNKKFGAPSEDAIRLLQLADTLGLRAAGLCFHVGSQYKSSKAYLAAIKTCRTIFDNAANVGLNLSVLDIGGGFPIPEKDDEFDASIMLSEISAALAQHFPHAELWCEPGRFLCGTAVNLITRVIGVQHRNGQEWYFLDEGLYGTFSGVIFDQWDFELESFKEGAPIPATFAGPSCDSLDIMFRDKLTPPLRVDDLILVPACGAYTSASATVFNGFSKAQRIVWEDEAGSE